jgi:hypothetical protein
VAEAVHRFVTRDFIEVLNDRESGWPGPRLTAGRVLLGTNRIRLELATDGAAPAWLEWEDRSGWLVAGCDEPGFLAALSDEQARLFANALAYLYKRAGVDLVREQIRAELPKAAEHFDIDTDGLLVWYGPRDLAPLLYDIADPADQLRPRIPGQRQPTAGPVLDAPRLAFDRVPLTWSQWTDVWRPPLPGDKPARLGPAGGELALLPPRTGRPLPASEPSANGELQAPQAATAPDPVTEAPSQHVPGAGPE